MTTCAPSKWGRKSPRLMSAERTSVLGQHLVGRRRARAVTADTRSSEERASRTAVPTLPVPPTTTILIQTHYPPPVGDTRARAAPVCNQGRDPLAGRPCSVPDTDPTADPRSRGRVAGLRARAPPSPTRRPFLEHLKPVRRPTQRPLVADDPRQCDLPPKSSLTWSRRATNDGRVSRRCQNRYVSSGDRSTVTTPVKSPVLWPSPSKRAYKLHPLGILLAPEPAVRHRQLPGSCHTNRQGGPWGDPNPDSSGH